MRKPAPLLAMLLLALVAGQATAQVTVDQRALEELKPKTKPHPVKPEPRRKPPAHVTAHHAPTVTHPHPATATRMEPPPPPPPFVPLTPPPLPTIPPPVAVPVRPEPPPPLPVLTDDAPDNATPLPNGLRVTFGAERSDLNPAADRALLAMVKSNPGPGTTYTIQSYAAGSPDDASVARRLSLGRGLTIRSVLIHAGVASDRIYLRALGSTAPAGSAAPVDRADITVSAPTKSAAEAPSPPKAIP